MDSSIPRPHLNQYVQPCENVKEVVQPTSTEVHNDSTVSETTLRFRSACNAENGSHIWFIRTAGEPVEDDNNRGIRWKLFSFGLRPIKAAEKFDA